MDSSNSSDGASANAANGERIFKKKTILVGSDFLKFFKDEHFCDVVLTTDDGKR